MRSRRVAAALAVTTSAALVLGACGGGGTSSGGGAPAGGAGAATDASISVYGGEPENPLVPGNTTEQFGSKVIDQLFDSLIEYGPDGSVNNVVAESIDTTDSKVYTIKLKPGWLFHDDTPVDAASFVDAWNYTAAAANAQSGSSFFSLIQGYADVNPAEGATATAETMSGLRVVDDTTFEVTLTEPSPIFATTIGYAVFSPLPDSFFADPAAFEANPIGNGPFRFAERTPNTNIILERFDRYSGPQKPSIQRVEFREYTDGNAAYQDLVAGNLDFLDTIPAAFLVDQIYQGDLPDRNGSQAYLGINSIAYPFYLPAYQNRDLRAAISMAIDRQAIADTVYGGLVTPADSFAGAGTPGKAENPCGELCTFAPDRAKELFATTGFAGPIELVTNVDSPVNQQNLQAVCQSITNTLGVACNLAPVPTFAEFLQQRDDRAVAGPFRSGWIADYPSIESFLNPLFRTGASSNDGDYSSPQFDELMRQGDSAASLDEANAKYQEAERVLVADAAGIPLYNPTTQFGWSERLQNVEIDFSRQLDLTTVTVAAE